MATSMRTLRENWVLLIPTSGLSALLPSDDESYVYTSAFSAAFAQHSTVYKIIVSKLSTDACKLTVHVVLNFKEMIKTHNFNRLDDKPKVD